LIARRRNTGAKIPEIPLGVAPLRLCVFALNAGLQPVFRLALGPEPAPSLAVDLFWIAQVFHFLSPLAGSCRLLQHPWRPQGPVKSVNKWQTRLHEFMSSRIPAAQSQSVGGVHHATLIH